MATLMGTRWNAEEARSTRMEHLEGLFKKYPDVTREAVIKADLQREGVVATEDVDRLSEGLVVRTYQLFSWDMSPLDKQVNSQPVRLPDMVYGFGGPYHLRRIAFRPRANSASPYLLDAIDGQPWILDKATRTPLVQLEPWTQQNPEWYHK